VFAPCRQCVLYTGTVGGVLIELHWTRRPCRLATEYAIHKHDFGTADWSGTKRMFGVAHVHKVFGVRAEHTQISRRLSLATDQQPLKQPQRHRGLSEALAKNYEHQPCQFLLILVQFVANRDNRSRLRSLEGSVVCGAFSGGSQVRPVPFARGRRLWSRNQAQHKGKEVCRECKESTRRVAR
jgi:hypothetical protein